MLEIAVFDICRVKERVCQLFEVFQHEFANLSLPCEGRFRGVAPPNKNPGSAPGIYWWNNLSCLIIIYYLTLHEVSMDIFWTCPIKAVPSKHKLFAKNGASSFFIF